MVVLNWLICLAIFQQSTFSRRHSKKRCSFSGDTEEDLRRVVRVCSFRTPSIMGMAMLNDREGRLVNDRDGRRMSCPRSEEGRAACSAMAAAGVSTIFGLCTAVAGATN